MEVLDNLGYYFLSKQDMQMQLAILWGNKLNKKPLMQNRITQSYTWEKITDEYIKLFSNKPKITRYTFFKM